MHLSDELPERCAHVSRSHRERSCMQKRKLQRLTTHPTWLQPVASASCRRSACKYKSCNAMQHGRDTIRNVTVRAMSNSYCWNAAGSLNEKADERARRTWMATFNVTPTPVQGVAGRHLALYSCQRRFLQKMWYRRKSCGDFAATSMAKAK